MAKKKLLPPGGQRKDANVAFCPSLTVKIGITKIRIYLSCLRMA